MSFKAFGLDIQITQSSVIGSIILFLVFTGVALALLQLSILGALVWGLIAVLLYWLSEFLHQMGHLIAGRRVGYPLTGMRLWWIFSASIYPKDEPTLPASVHIKRALGGAPMSIAIGVVFGILALLLKDSLDPVLMGIVSPFGIPEFVLFRLRGVFAAWFYGWQHLDLLLE